MTALAGGSGTLRPVLIHSSLRVDDADVRARSLSSGQVDPSLHYRSFYQAQLWWQVHQAHAPSGDRGVLDIYAKAAAATAARAAGQLNLVAVASGGGEKEGTLVSALVAQGNDVHYIPVDISVELALRSAEGADQGGLACTPIAGDISAMADFRAWLDAQPGASTRDEYPGAEVRAATATVVTAFGITPNMRPQVLFPWLRALVGAEDELLISANLLTSWQEILPQYDNPETATWLRQLFVDWGVASSLSSITFRVGDVDGIPAVIASAYWLTDQRWQSGAGEQHEPAGAELRVFFSLRFTPELFAATCEEFGLQVVDEFIDESSGEGVWRVRALLPAEGPGSHGRAGDGPAEQ